jgi:AraC family transcriptional regulator
MATLIPIFRDHPSFHLAGNRRWHTFADAPKTIPPQWQEFNQLPGRANARITYGVTCAADMPNQRFEYLAGYEVPDFSQLPPNTGRMIVTTAQYAVFTLDNVKEIQPFWQQFFQQWLPSSGFKDAHSPNFERYDERYDNSTGGPLEIWVPIIR